MILASCLAACVLAQEATVTFETKAVRLHAALEELSRVGKARLACHDSLRNEFVLLRLEGAPKDEALSRIAEVFQGQWIKSGETLRLVPKPGLRPTPAWTETVEKILQAGQEARPRTSQQELRKEIDERLSFVVPEGGTWDYKRYEYLSRLSPDSRLVNRMAAALGKDELLRLVNERRVVYSTSPTPRQRRLPDAAAREWDGFVAESRLHNLATKEARAAWEARTAGQDRGTYFYPRELPDYGTMPSSLMLVATRSENSAQFRVIPVYDPAEKLPPGLAYDTIQASYNIAGRPDEPGRPSLLPDLEGEYEPSPHAAWLSSLFARQPEPDPEAKPSEFADLVRHEPLAAVPSEVLMAAGRAAGKQVVAWLDDTSMFAMSAGAGQPATLRERFDALSLALQMELSEDGGWILVAPTGAWSPTRYSFSREAAVLLSKSDHSSPKRMDDMGRAAVLSDGPLSFMIAQVLGDVVSNRVIRTGLEAPYWLLKTYGLLGEAERRRIKSPEGLVASFGSLPPAVQATISKAVYEEPLEILKAPEDGVPPAAWDEERGHVYGENSAALTEPTLVLPNGVPPTATVTLQFAERETLFSLHGGPTFMGPPRATTVERAAREAAMNELTDATGRFGVRRQTFYYGSERQLAFSLRVGDRQAGPVRARFASDPPGGKALALAEMPEPFRKEYEAALAAARKEFEGVRPATRTPPPSRP